MSKKKHLLAIQLGESEDYPTILYRIATYRDGIFYVCSHLLSTGLYDIDLCMCDWGDSPRVKKDSPLNYQLDKYDAILISALGHQVAGSRDLLKRIRETVRDKPIIMGGAHASFAPYEALRYADFAVIGMGEYTVETLLNMIFHGPYPTPDNLPDRVAVKSDNGTLVIGKLSKQCVPMTPINPSLYKKVPRLNWATVNFSRGCPYNCTFCYGVRIQGNKLLKKDVDVIGAELDEIHRATDCPRFYISDLNFGLDKRFTRQIVDRVRGKGYLFTGMARIELGDDADLVEELKSAGLIECCLGIESLSDDTLSCYQKQSDGMLHSQRIGTFVRKGLAVVGAFVVGTDDQTYDDLIKTAKWAAHNKITFLSLAVYSDYPYQKRLYGTYQMYADWRLMQFSPAFQYFLNVVHFPRQMRPSKLQRTLIQAYNTFLEKRLSTGEQSHVMTRIKMWRRYMDHILDKMEKYVQYLETVEKPYYNSHDELQEDRLKDDYYNRARRDPEHFENISVVMK